MITLTTEIKSRRFKEYEKERLFKKLREPYDKKRDEVTENFRKYLDENVMGVVLDPDMKDLGEKPYCKRRTDRFLISPSEFGLPDTYEGLPNYKKCSTALKFEHRSDHYNVAVDQSIYVVNITKAIIKKCPKEVIDQIKFFLFEEAKAQFDYTFFGVGTYIKLEYYNSYGYYGIFPGLNTWGNLYSKSPEAFEMLYKSQEGKMPKEDVVKVEPEKKLLSELKTALGY
jgi:hypothetical protein